MPTTFDTCVPSSVLNKSIVYILYTSQLSSIKSGCREASNIGQIRASSILFLTKIVCACNMLETNLPAINQADMKQLSRDDIHLPSLAACPFSSSSSPCICFLKQADLMIPKILKNNPTEPDTTR